MTIAAMDCRRNSTTRRGRRERWIATTTSMMMMMMMLMIIICGSLHTAFLDWQRTVTAFSTPTTCSDSRRRITMMQSTTTSGRDPPHSSRPDASSSYSKSRHNQPKFRSWPIFVNQLHIPDSDSSVSHVEHGTIHHTIQYVPSMIVFQNVSHCYPRHNNNPNQIIRQLFSSIPDRLYAILQLSFTISSSSLLSVENDIPPTPLDNHQRHYQGGFVLLTGASSSGKSTMLQLIAHCSSSSSILPTHGTITIRTTVQNIDDDHHLVARPILLDTISISQYRLPYETRRTISDVLNDDIMLLMSPTDSTKNEPSRSTTLLPLMRAVVTDLLDRVELFPTVTEPNQCEIMSPSQLSTSQQYKLGMIRACLYSSGSGGRIETRPNNDNKFVLPGPILLLDECLDKETTATIRGIQSILVKLCTEMGAIVIVTTHVPQRWNTSPCIMTLCRGEILTTTIT